MAGPVVSRERLGSPPASWPAWLQALAVISEALPAAPMIVPVARAAQLAETAPGRLFGLFPEKWRQVLRQTPGAKLTPEGLELPVTRFQRPELEGEQAIRSGVFYGTNPKSIERGYRGGNLSGHGGGQEITGRTLVKNPLMVRGGQGGGMSAEALKQLGGPDLGNRVWGVAKYPGWYADESVVADVLQQIGGDPALADAIVQAGEYASLMRKMPSNVTNPFLAQRYYDPQGNVVRWAMLENALAQHARKQGFDSVLGIGQRGWGRPSAIHEVFDLREARYPTARGQYWLHPWVK